MAQNVLPTSVRFQAALALRELTEQIDKGGLTQQEVADQLTEGVGAEVTPGHLKTLCKMIGYSWPKRSGEGARSWRACYDDLASRVQHLERLVANMALELRTNR